MLTRQAPWYAGLAGFDPGFYTRQSGNVLDQRGSGPDWDAIGSFLTDILTGKRTSLQDRGMVRAHPPDVTGLRTSFNDYVTNALNQRAQKPAMAQYGLAPHAGDYYSTAPRPLINQPYTHPAMAEYRLQPHAATTDWGYPEEEPLYGGILGALGGF